MHKNDDEYKKVHKANETILKILSAKHNWRWQRNRAAASASIATRVTGSSNLVEARILQ